MPDSSSPDAEPRLRPGLPVQELEVVAAPGAQRPRRTLPGADVLRLVTVGRRNRAWAAIEVFEQLDDFDATIGARGRPAG